MASRQKPRAGKNKVLWVLGAPIRVLGRVKNLYVDGMTRCATGYNVGGAAPFTVRESAYASAFSRSTSTGDDDYRELMRAASQGRTGALNVAGMPRSQSVAVGRIDEDKPMEFGPDLKLGVGDMFPRSRSAVPIPRRTNRVGVLAG